MEADYKIERNSMAKPVNVEIVPRKGEPIERAIRRFTKKVKKEGIIEEYRNRKYYEKPSVKKRRKKIMSKRKAKQAQMEKNAALERR